MYLIHYGIHIQLQITHCFAFVSKLHRGHSSSWILNKFSLSPSRRVENFDWIVDNLLHYMYRILLFRNVVIQILKTIAFALRKSHESTCLCVFTCNCWNIDASVRIVLDLLARFFSFLKLYSWLHTSSLIKKKTCLKLLVLKLKTVQDCRPWNRGLQRDVVYLGWPIAPSYGSPNEGGGRSCGVTANKYSGITGAQINFGDLTPYLTYALENSKFPMPGRREKWRAKPTIIYSGQSLGISNVNIIPPGHKTYAWVNKPLMLLGIFIF